MGKDLKGKELGKGIRQKSNGMYSGRYTDRFGVRKEIYNRNLRQLKLDLERLVYENKMEINILDDRMTLNEWYNKWFEIHKYSGLSPNTRRYYEQVYTKHIKPALGNKKLSSITQLMIKKLIKDLGDNGLGFGTQNKVRMLLQDMFDKALIDNFVKRNPAKGIKLVRDEKKDPMVLTNEEQSLFFECCKGTFYNNLFVVALTTGLRLGELAALTWDDIDMDKMEINVTKTLLYQKLEGDTKKTFHFGNTKTKTSVRKVPFKAYCAFALKKQKMQKDIVAARGIKKVDDEFKDLLFVTRYNTPINSQNCADAMKRIIDEINLCRDDLSQIEYFSCHTLRHTFATRCFESGVQPKTVQKLLGHATLQMTMDLYTHVLEDHLQDEMSKLEEILDNTFAVSEDIVEEEFNMYLEEQDDSDNVLYYPTRKEA